MTYADDLQRAYVAACHELEAIVINTKDEATQRSLRSRILTKIQRIDNAINRLNDGKYGQCQFCQQPISAERLAHYPYVELCTACQRKTER